MLAMGLIAGIFGILAAVLAMLIGGIGSAFHASGAHQIVSLALSAMLLSILGIIGASIAKNRPKLAGLFMLIAGVGGFISISLFYIISGILFIVAGLIGVFTRKKKGNDVQLTSGEYRIGPEGRPL